MEAAAGIRDDRVRLADDTGCGVYAWVSLVPLIDAQPGDLTMTYQVGRPAGFDEQI